MKRVSLGGLAAALAAGSLAIMIPALSAGSAGASAPRPGTDQAKDIANRVQAGSRYQEPKVDAKTKALFARAQVLDEIVGKLTKHLSESGRAAIPGFTEVVVDPTNNHIRLYWKGQPAKYAMDILAHLPHGVTADVVRAKYSKADLHAARQRLLRNDAPMDLTVSGSAKPIRITSIRPAVDGSGLEIGYDEDLGVGHRVLADALSSTSRAAVTSEVAARARQITGVTVAPSYRTIGVDLSSRNNDSSPWWGGAGLLNPGGGICSSGFGFHNSAGSYLVTTAYHCGSSGVWHTWNNGAGGAVVGAADGGSGPYDVTAIWVNVSGAELYDGPSLPDSSYAKYVSSWGHNNVGDPVCVDGANSGVHCDTAIRQTDIGVTGPNGIYRPDVDEVTSNQSGEVASVDGDSGGPVFAGVNNWTSDQARGTISMNEYKLSDSCYPELQSPKNCYQGTFFVPIYTIMSTQGWTLNVN